MNITPEQLRVWASEIEDAELLLEDLPSGVDYDADPHNKSPDDMFAHIAGLAVQILDRLQKELERAAETAADKAKQETRP